ncbi:YybH family protein [Cesiribacter andamanensis]|uniref:DUF4440 domain-containing protein n=1 Tax=Cesiribacter andamanensis AMV16 TaxID=1279009 RepID=M7N9D1_9BACT|nr:SgcJ/EcaC family oxidoreductase [Cesiribacter andamanensis]EMR03867.1 hypothetical protein ADICEAN_01016 [Cesiribacter andamanensis AMV16]
MISTSTDISAAIRKANDAFEATFSRGDANGMAGLYTEQGSLLPTGTQIIQGREGIRHFWQSAMDAGIKEARLNTLEVEEQGDTAIEVGHYTLKGENSTPIDEGKYLVVWKQQNGNWKLHKDIWNSNQSPA